ncbi:MAG: ketoacyl-ACP synthase III [bacterium]|nr:ketoacyl-ACP synthase III [bacterium]
MQVVRKVRITGTGMYVPPRVVTNEDLTRLMDTTDEWIEQRTGIKERHHVDDGTGPSELAYESAKRAIENAGLKPEDLDAIVVASLSPEHDFPGVSCFLQDKLGLEGIPVMDVRCQCTGFLYALQVGQLFVAAGQYERVLVTGTEVHSTGMDFTTRGRDVAVIFGDGSSSVVLEPSHDNERGIMSIHTHADGKFAKKLWVPAPGSRIWPHRITHEMLDQGLQFPVMDGKFVFKHAVTRMPEVINEALDHNKCSIEDVDLFLFHQANLRINEFVGNKLGIPPEKTYNNIMRYGNCSSASIPMLLHECRQAGRVKEGDLIAMAGFGSGFTWGSALIRW